MTRPPRPHDSPCPTLKLVRLEIGAHQLRAADIVSTGRCGKPAWAAGLMVFRAVGDAPAQRPQEAAYLTLVTKTAFASTFTRADNGKTATYFARWINAKGEPGPWSPASVAAIAA